MNQAMYRVTLNPFQLVETINRAENVYRTHSAHTPQSELILSDHSLQLNSQPLGHFLICANESHSLKKFMSPFPRTYNLFRKIERTELLGNEHTLAEIAFEDLDLKVGLNICGYTKDATGNFELIKNPLTLPSGSRLEHLAFFYAVPLNSKYHLDNHKSLFQSYIKDNS
jgi:hypothetical protein